MKKTVWVAAALVLGVLLGSAACLAGDYGDMRNEKLDKGIEAALRNDTLIGAVRNNDIGEVEKLISEGVDVNARNSEAWTPFLEAMNRDRVEIARLMINKGADVNAKDFGGVTPLMWVAGYNHPDIARLLIEKGADVNARDRDGLTALAIAEKEGFSEVVQILKKSGARY